MAASADGFRIDTSEDDDGLRLRLTGEVDAATAPLLEARIGDAVRAGYAQVILDFVDLQFIDSSGLSVLVSNHKRLRDAGGDLVVDSPPAAALRLFEIAGLDRVLTIRNPGG